MAVGTLQRRLVTLVGVRRVGPFGWRAHRRQ
jgi:hypothetical protein